MIYPVTELKIYQVFLIKLKTKNFNLPTRFRFVKVFKGVQGCMYKGQLKTIKLTNFNYK